MKNKLRIILVLFVVYFCSYFFYGKNSLGLQIIENTTFHKSQDSIQIQIYNLEDYKINQLKIVEVLNEKGIKTVKVNYAENFFDKNKLSYWISLETLTPFVSVCYDGYFKKNDIAEEYESIYVWCFIKWVRVYKSKNRAMY